MGDNWKFFQHKDCEFFPCHKRIPENKFNCKYCYCPLFHFKDCGGNYKMLDNGVKDCSNCLVPHHGKTSCDRIQAKLYELYYKEKFTI